MTEVGETVGNAVGVFVGLLVGLIVGLFVGAIILALGYKLLGAWLQWGEPVNENAGQESGTSDA